MADLALGLEVVKEVVCGERIAVWLGRWASMMRCRSDILDAASKAEEVRLVDNYRVPVSEVCRVVD